MKTIRLKPNDVITSMIVEETFVFCYELGKGFIKRNIERLNLEVYTFENIVAEIEAMSFTELTSTGFDSILFVNGSINESKKITETVQTELNLIPIGTHASFVDDLIETKKTKSRYFDITRAAPIKVILGNANFISDTNIEIVENISVGTAVSSDLILIKQDNYNYTLENYTDTFEFVNGILKTKGSIDYETRINYVLQIKISDKVDPTKFWNDIVNVEVINVPDTISINQTRTLTIDENSSNGTVIGDLHTLFTKEEGLNVSFTLNNNGEKFGISGNNLVVNGLLDYESTTQYILTVRITNVDNTDMFWDMDVTVNVNNITEGPSSFAYGADFFGDGSGIAWYPFNGNVTDIDGQYNATVVGTVTYTTSKYDRGVKLSSTSTNYISVSPKLMAFGTNNFAVSTTINVSSFPASNSALFFTGIPSTGANGNGMGLRIRSDRKVSVAGNNSNQYVSVKTLDLNTTYHIVLTRISGISYLYIDGLLDGSFVDTTNYSNVDGASIGGWNISGANMNGWIDNSRVFNKGLTTLEINELFMNDAVAPAIKVSLVDVFGDNSGLAWYPMNGNTNDVGGKYNLTNTNGIFVDGKYGKAISIPANGNLSIGSIPKTSMMTISNWINGVSTSGYMAFGRKSGNVAYNGSYWFRIMGGLYSAGRAQISVGASYRNYTTGKTGWNHYVSVLNMTNSTFTTYVNGVFVETLTFNSADLTAINSYTDMVGLNQEVGVDTASIIMDNIRVFNKALSAEEVTVLYTLDNNTPPAFIPEKTDCFSDGSGTVFYKFNGTTNDESGLKNGTNTAGTFIGNNGENKSINLQGSSAAVTIPSYTLGTNFTISARCKMLSTGSATASILRANTTGWNTSGLEFLAGISNGKVNFNSSWCNGTARSSGGIAYNDICLVDTFYTVTLTRAGSVYNMYVAGVWVGTHSNSTTGQSLASPVIGNYNNGTNYGSNLVVDNFRLFNRALTQSEITTLFNNDNYTPIAVDKADFFDNNSAIALYKMDGNVNNESGINNGIPTSLTYGEAKVGQSALFNGSSSKVMTSTVFPTGGGSLSLWVYMTKTTNDNMIIGNSGNIYFGLTVNAATANPMGISINNNSTNGTGFSSGKNVLKLNTWHHIVIVDTNSLVSGNTKCYVDGIFVPHNLPSWTNAGTLGGLALTNIGNYVPSTVQNFGGKMRQFRVFNKPLTQQQVTDLMNAESPFIK